MWETVDDLAHFTYKTLHRDVLSQRAKWFVYMCYHFQALWYISTDSFPSVNDARERLNYLQSHGPTPMAFTFAKRFSAEEYQEMLKL